MSDHFLPVQCIVGLGNPGPQYDLTRHNVGWWLINRLAADHNISLRDNNKLHGIHGKGLIDNHECHLLMPTTFMNNSGQAVVALANYYKIPPQSILVVHDELDLPPGIARLKPHGGHGGHNGLRNIIQQLHSDQFFRLRLGVGKPQHKSAGVDYVLNRPNKTDENKILDAIELALPVIPQLCEGQHQQAMQSLHQQ